MNPNDDLHRSHSSAAFWITVALVVLLVGYPLSFGPACWWFSEIVSDTGGLSL